MKKLLFTSVLLIGLSFFACNRGDDEEPDGLYKPNMIFNELTTSLFTPDEDGYRLKPVLFDSLWQGDTLSMAQLYISLEASDVSYVAVRNGPGFETAAYAEAIVYSLKNAITAASIVSNKEVHTLAHTYEAGQELAHEFLYGQYGSEGLMYTEDSLPAMSRSIASSTLCFMQLDAQLLQALDQTFTIQVEFEDGHSLSTTTQRILAK